jgi:polygalacturonase
MRTRHSIRQRGPVGLFVLVSACTPPPAAPKVSAPPPTVPLPASSGGTDQTSDPALPGEPTLPAACASLTATKHAPDGLLADTDELLLDTARIQTALDACPPGQAVKLVATATNQAFLSGPLNLGEGRTLWIDAGVTLYASRNPRDFDLVPGNPTCGTHAHNDHRGCRSLINVDGVSGAAVVGWGAIDGRGGEPMLGSDLTWWDVAQEAKSKAVRHSNPRLVDVRSARNFALYGVSLFNGPKFHVSINSQSFLVWGIKILTPSRPQNSRGRPLTPFYARKTDGVDPTSASHGVIAYSEISVGDDQIAIKAGDAGPTRDLVIAHNRFGSGHGMSIGSETNGGVSNIKVYDLSIDGDVEHGGAPDVDLNGIRIKSDSSRGGLVENVSYTDVCIRDVPNAIILTPHYSAAQGSRIPVYRNIVLNDVFVVKGSQPKVVPRITLLGWSAEHKLSVTLDGLSVDGIAPEHVKAAFAEVTLGPGAVNFMPTGEGVTVETKGEPKAREQRCAEKFARAVRR